MKHALERPIAAITTVMALVGLTGCAARHDAPMDASVALVEGWNEEVLNHDPRWYASPPARSLAETVALYQSAEGGFPKNTDLSAVPSAALLSSDDYKGRANTFDNHATTTPIEFLAKVHVATGDDKYRRAVDKGISYILKAQYPSGGWPQFYPLRVGYYSHITFNDDAMARIVEFLRRVGRGDEPFSFLDQEVRDRASHAADRGVELILKLQIVEDGKPAIWAAQYDETNLEPAWARRYEPPSLSGSESVGIVRLLMGEENPSPAVVASIEGAVAWFRGNAIRGYRLEKFTDDRGAKDARIVPDPSAPPVWARFYELKTGRPLFLGRDSVFHYNLMDIEQERRGGYNYYGSWPSRLIESEYPAWKVRLDPGY